MSDEADAALYELRLRKVGGQWLVSGESRAAVARPGERRKSFLPPRTVGDAGR